MGGAVEVTWLFLTGGIAPNTTPAFAAFNNCGQGLRAGGDVKLRGVLVGRIGDIERSTTEGCTVKLDLIPSDIDEIPANVGAEIRAKTVFGEKWVELLYPGDPSEERIAEDDVIPIARTIDPLEVETILNVALPLLEAIDPEQLAGALDALAGGFVGHEDAAIRGIEAGIEALRPLNDNSGLLKEGIRQLDESGDVLQEVDDDLIAAFRNLDDLNRFTIQNSELIAASLQKTPALLQELSVLFETRFVDFTKLVNQGATVIGVVAAHTDDLDRLLTALPKFNSAWIRNLGAVCRARQDSDTYSVGDRVPGRCWRVHNLIAESRGAYEPGEEPEPERARARDYTKLGLDLGLELDLSAITKLLYQPALVLGGPR